MADLSEVNFRFVQDGNTNGTTEEVEVINITMEAPLYINKEDGAFITIKTETGWSINSPEELNDMIKQCYEAVLNIAPEKT